MGQWVGRWAGGRIAKTKAGLIYHLEKQVDGKPVGGSLGPIGEKGALDELRLFHDNPHAYKTKPVRDAEAASKIAEAVAETRAGAVVMTPLKIASFIEYFTKGRDNAKHAKDHLRYLTAWAIGPLAGRDLRLPYTTLADLNRGLDTWTTCVPKRIVALRAFSRWLRKRGELTTATDPTLMLECIQAEKPDEQEKAAKVYTPEHIALHYKHLDRQDVRDVIYVRSMTGMHLSEIGRVAKGKRGRLEALKEGGEVGGKAVYTHKNKRTHVTTLTVAAFAAFQRIAKRGRIPDSKSIINCMDRANLAAREETKDENLGTVVIANLRHSFVTNCRKRGREVKVPNTEALSIQLIATRIGHTSTNTTTGWYDASDWPSLIIPPYDLWHPNDPVVPGERHLRAVS